MYMVLISINRNKLKDHPDVYKSVEDLMVNNGFDWYGGPLYIGNEYTDAVDCVLVIQKLVAKFPYIKDMFSDIQMLRVEEMTDLSPAIGRVTSTFK